ncbi:MAPEG family protein [Parashewanella tropica]|uniref:MAPEG family protein n=1 Tax=Parashewanella tropica TaxID=2547970 RepID=UPI0014793CAB|nr:MAPEG family protein [Parashewanella tropica]
MVSPIYAALLTLLLITLAFKVISLRRKHRISIGNGGNQDLAAARAAMSNASEYIPIFLILLFSFEYLSQSPLFTHLIGSIFIIGRCMHAFAISNHTLQARFWGMILTFSCLVVLAVAAFFLVFINR